MKKKIYSVFLILAVATMASSCNGCGGNINKTSADSALSDSTKKQDSLAKDSTFPKPVGPKGKAKVHSALSDSAAKRDSAAMDSTFPKPGPKKKANVKAN